jgi:two-component system OmpR family response regulator
MRILVVEDDKRTSDYMRKGFTERGHVTDALADGRDALAHASREFYDVLVVDRMLPGLDGLALVKALRASGITTPVLFLTAVGGSMIASMGSRPVATTIWSSPSRSPN